MIYGLRKYLMFSSFFVIMATFSGNTFAGISETLFLTGKPVYNSSFILRAEDTVETGDESYIDKLKRIEERVPGLHLNAGMTIAKWSFNSGGLFEITQSSASMLFVEAFYSNVLLNLSEGLQLFRRPYFKIQTDLGSAGSADLISSSGQQSINPQGNLKLLALTNIIDPLFFRYDKEIYSAGITSYGGFDFFPFTGEILQVQPQEELLLNSEFQCFEIGIKGLVGEDGFAEFSVYHNTWQKPWSQDTLVYSSVFDFTGIGLGFWGETDFYRDGKVISTNSMGYYFKIGQGKIDLTKNKSLSETLFYSYDDKPFNHVRFELEYRQNWPINDAIEMGLILDYYFQRVEYGVRNVSNIASPKDLVISRDQRFLFSMIIHLLG